MENNRYIDHAFDVVYKHTGITEEEIKSFCRTDEFFKARCLLSYLCLKEIHMTTTSIGKLQNRSHSAILYQVYTLMNDIKYDKCLNDRFNRCLEDFRDLLNNDKN